MTTLLEAAKEVLQRIEDWGADDRSGLVWFALEQLEDAVREAERDPNEDLL